MPKQIRIQEGDIVSLRAKVTRVDEGDSPENDRVTVLIDGYATPVTLRGEWVEPVGKAQKQMRIKDLGL